MKQSLITTRLNEVYRKFGDLTNMCSIISKDIEGENITTETKKNIIVVKRLISLLEVRVSDISSALRDDIDKYSDSNINREVAILSHIQNSLKEWNNIILDLSMQAVEIEVNKLSEDTD